MTFRPLGAAAVVALLATACGGSTTSISEITAPDPIRCQTSISPPSTLPHAGGRVTLSVVAGRECAWTARSEASWAQISPASGQGEASVMLTVSANPDAQTRSGAVLINDTRMSLTQEAAPCRFNLGSSQAQMSQEGGRATVGLSTSGSCGWRANSNATWARVAPDSGTGSATVEVTVADNLGSERIATITIGDQTFTVSQEARRASPGPAPVPPPPAPNPNPNPPPNPTPTCSNITIDSSERSFSASGGDGSIRVTAPPGCPWSASTGASWIELNGSSGSGNDTVRYRVAQNSTTSPRNATITIAGRAHTVRQDPGSSGGGDDDDDDDDDDGERVHLRGIALLVTGSCPGVSFLVDFRRVFTDGDTRFRRGSCGDLRTGTEVEIEGRMQSDGRVRATEVRVRD